MKYIFDTCSFRVISHYFPNQFPSFWDKFDLMVEKGELLSVREVYVELEGQNSRPHMVDWMKKNKHIFLPPTRAETEFIAIIFSVKKFQALIRKKQILTSGPVADPFIIASGKINNACIVTEESNREGLIRIPHVCSYFTIDCNSTETFLKQLGWVF